MRDFKSNGVCSSLSRVYSLSLPRIGLDQIHATSLGTQCAGWWTDVWIMITISWFYFHSLIPHPSPCVCFWMTVRRKWNKKHFHLERGVSEFQGSSDPEWNTEKHHSSNNCLLYVSDPMVLESLHAPPYTERAGWIHCGASAVNVAASLKWMRRLQQIVGSQKSYGALISGDAPWSNHNQTIIYLN